MCILQNGGTKYVGQPADPYSRFLSRAQALSSSNAGQGSSCHSFSILVWFFNFIRPSAGSTLDTTKCCYAMPKRAKQLHKHCLGLSCCLLMPYKEVGIARCHVGKTHCRTHPRLHPYSLLLTPTSWEGNCGQSCCLRQGPGSVQLCCRDFTWFLPVVQRYQKAQHSVPTAPLWGLGAVLSRCPAVPPVHGDKRSHLVPTWLLDFLFLCHSPANGTARAEPGVQRCLTAEKRLVGLGRQKPALVEAAGLHGTCCPGFNLF